MKVELTERVNRVNRKDVTVDRDVDKYDEETQTTPELHEWKKRNSFINAFDPDQFAPLSNAAPQLILSSTIQLFYLMFPKERMQYYAEMTKRYAALKGRNLEVDGDDIEQFFGILLFSGYRFVPSENRFWSTSEDTQVLLVFGTMIRNRFREQNEISSRWIFLNCYQETS
ncbi:PiggyBac transposable element-derived protein 2 [Trichinella britovi]|nr:PiggyBac transposable element-derived protein 2 [Trichinella britovi]KRZ83574.1 PiggyBac transposable element-derived protein 2 [Trichinella sp. T8]